MIPLWWFILPLTIILTHTHTHMDYQHSQSSSLTICPCTTSIMEKWVMAAGSLWEPLWRKISCFPAMIIPCHVCCSDPMVKMTLSWLWLQPSFLKMLMCGTRKLVKLHCIKLRVKVDLQEQIIHYSISQSWSWKVHVFSLQEILKLAWFCKEMLPYVSL